jgi:hypothetical protein
LSVEKFARWLRAICTMLLARNTAPDRLKAIGYIEQAIVVLEEHGGDSDDEEVINPLFPPNSDSFFCHSGDKTYPMDERYWLLTTCYNTGIECLQYGFTLQTLRASFTHVSKCLLAGRC